MNNDLIMIRAIGDDLEGLKPMAAIVAIASILVLIAMVIDLISGLQKAKMRGEVRSSWGLKRTMNKFVLYEGGLAIAFGIDVLIHLSRLFELIGITLLDNVPIVSILVALGLLVVEGISVRESADEKTRIEMQRVIEAAGRIIDREEIVKAVKDAIGDVLNGKKSS